MFRGLCMRKMLWFDDKSNSCNETIIWNREELLKKVTLSCGTATTSVHSGRVRMNVTEVPGAVDGVREPVGPAPYPVALEYIAWSSELVLSCAAIFLNLINTVTYYEEVGIIQHV
ncbi:hypothetical protein PoB_006597200 [Plakobranchus ocellatus]|uniref:Uncharacterized protein n=1 Tax=Plakobranchus ocellatus TaxID=259542 RepID=A0AAV4D5I9_9GAST|nr:hypothetical protein PoB_006597200 [Plakobranchus ocellatus]